MNTKLTDDDATEHVIQSDRFFLYLLPIGGLGLGGETGAHSPWTGRQIHCKATVHTIGNLV